MRGRNRHDWVTGLECKSVLLLFFLTKENMSPRSLLEVATSERTDEELQEAYEAYIASKTVNGALCLTPDLTTHRRRRLDVDVAMSTYVAM